MKRTLLSILYLLVLLSYSGQSHAQHSNVGIKGGVNSTGLGQSLSAIANNYHVGVYVQHEFNSKFELQAEVNYSLRESTYQESFVELKEMQIPVILRYKARKPFYFQAGVQYNFLADVRQEDKRIEEAFDSSHFNGIVGVGVDLPSGFDMSVRYIAGQHHFFGGNQFSGDLIQVSVAFDIY
ncbi:MAG: PorT family protein [Reichenbachiella sp.]